MTFVVWATDPKLLTAQKIQTQKMQHWGLSRDFGIYPQRFRWHAKRAVAHKGQRYMSIFFFRLC